jgi:Uma2 family endonuclease
MIREAAEPYQLTSVEEYLRQEEMGDVRHEYVGGYLYAKAGATRRHNEIALNIAAHLLRSRGERCRVSISDVQLRAASNAYYYPDVMVTCDARDSDARIVRHPCLLVEVLFDSTEMIDRREKLVAYQRIPSLLSYLIVHQDAALVEWHWRDDPETPWRARNVTEGAVASALPAVELPIAAIYDGITLPSAP